MVELLIDEDELVWFCRFDANTISDITIQLNDLRNDAQTLEILEKLKQFALIPY